MQNMNKQADEKKKKNEMKTKNQTISQATTS